MTTPTTDDRQARRFYSIRSAAHEADCSESHIRRAIDNGYLISHKPKGSTIVRIPHESLEQWIKGE